MKYLIISSFEIDGHASGSVMLCDSAAAKQQYLHVLLYNEDEQQYYPTKLTSKEDDGSTTIYGDWDCGQWSINILPFKTFKEITNRERYAQTG